MIVDNNLGSSCGLADKGVGLVKAFRVQILQGLLLALEKAFNAPVQLEKKLSSVAGAPSGIPTEKKPI